MKCGSEILNPRANCKTPAVCSFQGPFPLAPTLSLRERENQCPRCEHSKRLGLSNALPMMLPLPKGEGEQSVRIPERCGFCNRLPKLQIPNKSQISSHSAFWNLELGICLGFGIWFLGFKAR